MIVYHGTRSPSLILANGFSPSRGGEFGPGVYVTESIDSARFWGGVVARGEELPAVVRASVSLERPRRVLKTEWIKLTERSSPRSVQRRWMRAGHDGILGVGINGVDVQVVVFDPTALRDAEVIEREIPGIGWVEEPKAEPLSAAVLREAIGRLDRSGGGGR